ncbi:MAG: stage II sporulation protein M [Anaeromyxobacter sp.]
MTVTLKSATFRTEREGTWRELEGLLAQVERGGVRSLEPRALARLPVLYRAALSSLSVARAISLDRNVLDYLEALCGRAYLVVYGARRRLSEAVGDFFVRRFPAAVRAHWPHLALAFGLLLAGTWAGFALVRADPERYYAFVGAGLAQGRTPTASTETLREVLYQPRETAEMLKTFAMALFTHNTSVGLGAFALGFAAGLPTVWLLFQNGLILGAMGALYHSRGLSPDFWGWILPHGVSEFTAIALCGAAGLAIGQALVFPGQEERRAALARRGRDAGVLVVGAVALFLVAGLIEGIFRQLVHDMAVRYTVAGVTLVGWTAYFALAGHARRERRP